jgi:hypothetical protein
MSRRGLLKLASAGAVTLGVGAATLGWADPASATQPGWRWCYNCAGLAWNGTYPATGACFGNPKGGKYGHILTDSIGYVVKESWEGGAGQDQWKWCQACNLMNYDADWMKNACPAGNFHDNSASTNYIIEYSGHIDGARGQDNWRWCSVCSGLFYNGATNNTDGSCIPYWNEAPALIVPPHTPGGTDYIVRY